MQSWKVPLSEVAHWWPIGHIQPADMLFVVYVFF